MRRLLLRGLIVVLAALVLVVLAGGIYVRSELRASLPALEGTLPLAGLTAPVTVTRDALGVPSLSAASRVDLARALGFVHAQDRFFQMDLQRRQPSGELAALVGARAFEVDAQARIHRFRHVAQQAYERADPEWKALLDAYASGVNAGLAQLSAPPFEYLMLRTAPEPWKAEDSILTILAMFVSLQGRQATFEQTNQQLRAALPEPMFRFLAEAGSNWDSPAIGDPLNRPPVPGPEVIDLRGQRTSAPPSPPRRSPRSTSPNRRAARRSSACASSCRAKPPPPLDRTTGRWTARTAPMGAPSSPTTCTSGSACRTSGIACR